MCSKSTSTRHRGLKGSIGWHLDTDDMADTETETPTPPAKKPKYSWMEMLEGGKPDRERKPIPELLSEYEKQSIMGTARPSSNAAMVDPEVALRKAFIRSQYIAYTIVMDVLLNGGDGASAKLSAAKMIFDEAK